MVRLISPRMILAPLLSVLLLAPAARAFDGWLPLSQDDLTMKATDKAPGASAIILYKQVDRDDDSGARHEHVYKRIKILTEEGRKYATVDVVFGVRSDGKEAEARHISTSFSGLKGRTIHPDGAIVEFDGSVFDQKNESDKTSVKDRRFSLNDVHAGDIIEYQVNVDLDDRYIFSSHWTLSEPLYVREAKFSLKPNHRLLLRWSWPAGLPAGTQPPVEERLTGLIHMEAHDIPALPREDFMPPLNTLEMRVVFSYTLDRSVETDPVKFWRAWGKKEYGLFESFLGSRGELQSAAQKATAGAATDDQKARKLYDFVLSLENTSLGPQRSRQELERDKAKTENAGDVLRQGRGSSQQLNWLYCGLARASGLDATPVMVSARDLYIFAPQLMDPHQLNGDLVQLKLGKDAVWLDLGAKFAPYGILPWEKTATRGMALDRDGGTWVDLPIAASADNTIETKAEFQLQENGTLQGTLTITYTGVEAMIRREGRHEQDDTARKKFLEEQVRNSIPVGATVDLTRQPDWKGTGPMVAKFNVSIAGWVTPAGRRAVCPVGFFTVSEKEMFTRTTRFHNIYFHFPYRKLDDVKIELPAGWSVASLPAAWEKDAKAAAIIVHIEANGNQLHVTRVLRNDLLTVEVKNYASLRQFFSLVRTGDELQAVLQPAGATSPPQQ